MTAGLIATQSKFGPTITLDRLIAAIAGQGMTVLAGIDHGAAAASAGLVMRATTVVIFGNPGAGTLLMQAVQTIGIDLPLKALVWEDDEGRTWVGTNDLAWLARRHGIDATTTPILGTIAAMLATVTAAATG